MFIADAMVFFARSLIIVVVSFIKHYCVYTVCSRKRDGTESENRPFSHTGRQPDVDAVRFHFIDSELFVFAMNYLSRPIIITRKLPMSGELLRKKIYEFALSNHRTFSAQRIKSIVIQIDRKPAIKFII